jgi:hypothetical protein
LLSPEDESTVLVLPETFQTPHPHHLALMGFGVSIGSRLLTAIEIVTLAFSVRHLLQLLSFMPQLDTLVIARAPFYFLFPTGLWAYMKAVVSRISTGTASCSL